jgi:hypothetical protein
MDTSPKPTEDIHGADLAMFGLDRFTDLQHLGNGCSGFMLGDERGDVEGNIGVNEDSCGSRVTYIPSVILATRLPASLK